MLNHIVIMGRLTRDPELRRTQSGIAVTSFRVAVERDFRTQNGERETDFIDVVAWRNQAEFVTKYFTKGRMIIVEGQLQIRDWTDKEGQRRTSAEIVADRMYFGDSRRDNNNGEYGGVSGGQSYGSAPAYGGASGGSGYGSAPASGGYGSAPASGGYGSAPASGGYGSGYGSAPASGGYGGGYGSAPASGGYGGGYGSAPASGGNSDSGYGASAAPGYGSAPAFGGANAPGYGSAGDNQSDFAELGGEDDGDLPF